MNLVITEEEVQKIISFYLEPNTLNHTQKVFGRSISSIKKILLANNIEIRTREADLQIAYVRRKQTNLQKYGHANVGQFGSAEFNNAMLEKYGTKNNQTLAFVRDKVESTCLKKYGVKCNLSSKDPKLNGKATLLERYGVTHNSKLPSFSVKVHEAWNKKSDEEKALVISKIMVSKQKSKHITHKYKCNGIYFDSIPELAFYIYTVLHTNKQILREPVKLKYTWNNKTYHYIPDFQIGENLYEIKGEYWLSQKDQPGTQDFAKYQCMLANKVIVLFDEDYKFYVDWFKSYEWNEYDFTSEGLKKRSKVAEMADLLD